MPHSIHSGAFRFASFTGLEAKVHRLVCCLTVVILTLLETDFEDKGLVPHSIHFRAFDWFFLKAARQKVAMFFNTRVNAIGNKL